MPFASTNPATGATIARFDAHDDDAVDARLNTARAAFLRYRHTSFAERAGWLHAAADILERERHALARMMTLEMGKPLAAAVAEAEKCAWGCRFYADHAERFLGDEIIATSAAQSFVRCQPLGVVLAVMPWNFPFWQVFRCAAPTLMAGNVMLLKHAANVPRCALTIEDIFQRAGFAHGVFQALLIESGRVESVLRDDRVAAVTLTGSEAAGRAVARTAGDVIKKSVLELGGSDPFIVLPGADLDTAVATAVRARTINNGQSCIAAKRFIIHERVYDRFVQDFVARLDALVVGDPLDDATDIGPLATESIMADLDRQVRDSVAAGARILAGGRRLDRTGWYYAPTALADIPRDAPAYHEELFGPVAAIFRVHSIDEAIALANDSRFGLGAAAWTSDPGEQARLVDGIEAGTVFINAMVASDPRLPFGGIKRSGYGRELGSAGIREFVNIKTVSVGSTVA